MKQSKFYCKIWVVLEHDTWHILRGKSRLFLTHKREYRTLTHKRIIFHFIRAPGTISIERKKKFLPQKKKERKKERKGKEVKFSRHVSQLSHRKSTMTLFSTISQQFFLGGSNPNHDWREVWILMWHILGRFIFIWELGPTFFRFLQLLKSTSVSFLRFMLFFHFCAIIPMQLVRTNYITITLNSWNE